MPPQEVDSAPIRFFHIGHELVLDRPLSLGSLVVESVVLMKSELSPTGSVYTKLWEMRLKKEGLPN